MQIPITCDKNDSPQQVPIGVEYEHPLPPNEELPAYSREPTEDGHASEYLNAVDEKRQLDRSLNQGGHDQLVLPTEQLPGYAPETVLQRGLQVPTKSRLITSGFEYPEILAKYDVTEEQWANFTRELTKEAEMTPGQWTTTVGAGVGTFVVGGIFVGWLGVIPAAILGHKLRQHNEIKNFVQAREKHVLGEIINRWNDVVFKPKGLIIRIDLPGETMDIHEMDLSGINKCKEKKKSHGPPPFSSAKQQAKQQAKEEKRAIRAARKEIKARGIAARKGRIVILPLNQAIPERSPLRGVADPMTPMAGSPVRWSSQARQTHLNEKLGPQD